MLATRRMIYSTARWKSERRPVVCTAGYHVCHDYYADAAYHVMLLCLQVWDSTPELKQFRADRFKLELNESLAAVFRQLAAQSLAENVNPNTWMHHGTRYTEHLKSDTAHQRVQKLRYQSQIEKLRNQPPSISNIPLVHTAHGLVHDPSVLPILPPCLENHWTRDPLHAKPQLKWSEFHTLSFESAQSLIQQAGPSCGIYQIWVSRRMVLPNGTCRVMRAEVYIGSAIGAPVNMLVANAKCLPHAVQQHGFPAGPVRAKYCCTIVSLHTLFNLCVIMLQC